MAPMAVPVQQMEPSHQPRAAARARSEAVASREEAVVVEEEEEKERPRGGESEAVCAALCCLVNNSGQRLTSLRSDVCKPLDFSPPGLFASVDVVDAAVACIR